MDSAILLRALLPLVLLAGSSSTHAPAHTRAGIVEGRVTLPDAAPRRWAARYPGAGMGSARLHPVRPVVYLTGDLPSAPHPGPDVEIRQEQGRFTPSALAVRTGTVVHFPNQDEYYHNVFSYSGPRFDLGRYPAGESRQVTFDQAGIVAVYCEVHEFMRAIVLVTHHAYHAAVDIDGSFRIEGVPPGEYMLHAYHPDWDALEVSVSVTDGGSVRLSLHMGG